MTSFAELNNPRCSPAHEAFDSWPRTVRGRMIEPTVGVVRVRRPRQRPLELSTTSCRLLAAQVDDPDHGEVLSAAADEADRQYRELMHGPMPGTKGPRVDELMQDPPEFACS